MNVLLDECYYKILGVEVTATEEQLKNCYKEKLLMYHPDKNRSLSEEEQRECALKFLRIREAYECLSNPVSRRNYDIRRRNNMQLNSQRFSSHRGTAEKLSPLNISFYFFRNCFNNFDDSEDGFYYVYRILFKRIIDEENEDIIKESIFKNKSKFSMEAVEKKLLKAPCFGDSKSQESEVRKFYIYWEDFVTNKTFNYGLSENENYNLNRQIRRLLQKKQAKCIQEKRKQYNEDIKLLVQTVKNWDPRYVRITKKKEETICRREQNERVKTHARNQGVAEETVEMGEDKMDKQQMTFRTNTSAINERFRRDTSPFMKHFEEPIKSPDLESVNEKILYFCEPCKKYFKSENQLIEHQKSKKHKKLLNKKTCYTFTKSTLNTTSEEFRSEGEDSQD